MNSSLNCSPIIFGPGITPHCPAASWWTAPHIGAVLAIASLAGGFLINWLIGRSDRIDVPEGATHVLRFMPDAAGGAAGLWEVIDADDFLADDWTGAGGCYGTATEPEARLQHYASGWFATQVCLIPFEDEDEAAYWVTGTDRTPAEINTSYYLNMAAWKRPLEFAGAGS